MADQRSEALNASTITESFGMVGSALANDSTDQPNSDSEKLELQEFLKQLVSSTAELASQFEELNILQKDMILDERRKTAEELSELKAGEQKKDSSLIEPLNGLADAIAKLTKLIEETDFNSTPLDIPTPVGPRRGATPQGPPKPKSGGASPFGGKLGGLGSKALGAFGALLDFGSRTALEGQSVTQASVGVGGSLAGGLALGKLGLALGALTGPAAPVAAPVLSILLGTGGYFLGGLAADTAYDTVTGTPEQTSEADVVTENAQPVTDTSMSTPVQPTPIQTQPIAQVAPPQATPALTPVTPMLATPQPALAAAPDLTPADQIQRPIDSVSFNLNRSVLAKTEEVEQSESTIEVASPIVAGQSSNEAQQPLKATTMNFDTIGVDEVPDPNYNGGILELELYR
jgi:hypothetical protein